MNDRKPSPVMALRWYEEALALASFMEGQGWPDEAATVRAYATRIKPASTSARWAERVS